MMPTPRQSRAEEAGPGWCLGENVFVCGFVCIWRRAICVVRIYLVFSQLALFIFICRLARFVGPPMWWYCEFVVYDTGSKLCYWLTFVFSQPVRFLLVWYLVFRQSTWFLEVT